MGLFSWLFTGEKEKVQESSIVRVPDPNRKIEVPHIPTYSPEIEAVVKDIKENPENWFKDDSYARYTQTLGGYYIFYNSGGIRLRMESHAYVRYEKTFRWDTPPYSRGAPDISKDEDAALVEAFTYWLQYHEQKAEAARRAKYRGFQQEVFTMLEDRQLKLDF